MRQIVVTIRWDGPDKKVREFIEEKVDALFVGLSWIGGVTYADSDVKFTSKVKGQGSHQSAVNL